MPPQANSGEVRPKMRGRKSEEGKGKREKGKVHTSRSHNFQFSIFNFQLILRLPQIFKYQLHLSSCEVAVVDTVARSEQRGQQAVSMVDVAVETAQSVRGRADGEVHCGQLAFGVRFNHICLECRVSTPSATLRKCFIPLVPLRRATILFD